ncbi:adapter protein MecA 1 [Sporosarcina sp. NCCP-2716]|uniref:adaptor protein MecA n=1 Tax=Sporosarcina sp. NCCP-2716 TaxID=2943679 RepID=UPI0020400745|nr:adaptor protein MecA [Sporosarcina sp. NCCP-2716]GKV67573.1 adapter protein MecA 1 [Sporosarcina sp. NCCP-2716]
MEIERINENTVKFYLSYVDIEERGFTREEVWYNRDKSEELFWDMMEEIDTESDIEFEIEGPLWIQVHAMSGGIEVLVTRAQLPEDGESTEYPYGIDDPRKLFQPELEAAMDTGDKAGDPLADNRVKSARELFAFSEFDDLIPLASQLADFDESTALYSFENKYYLHIDYTGSDKELSDKIDIESIVLEFAVPTNMTVHRLQEYGTEVMGSEVFQTINSYF